jgi:exodeoxyribonuclease VII large subunit
MPEGIQSLSELLGRVGRTLKQEFPDPVWIIAEILELHVNQKGHCYLELVEKSQADDTLLARAKAAIWASRFQLLRPFFETSTGMQLRNGIKILVRGAIEFHPQFGFSIQITDIDPSYTLGDMARKKQEVIRRLREEGIMEMNREIPFPMVPQRIAVISSPTAAGYGDFLETILRNPQGYSLQTRLFEAVMQGEGAPSSMIGAFDSVFAFEGEFDCVVVIRGGGSRADLECFNSYDLAYYITQFPLPVITGIGHERDESVTDLVAARSLKTPTAVAEFLLDRMMAFEIRLSGYRDRLATAVNRTVASQGLMLERYKGDLSHLYRGFLEREAHQLRQSSMLLKRAVSALLARQTDRLSLLGARCEGVDPENILRRGYSMTLHDGRAITTAEGLGQGDRIETRLYRGTLSSIIETTSKQYGEGKD